MSITHTVETLSGPLVTKQQILDVLKRDIPQNVNVPIYDEYPNDSAKVRYGLYVTAPDVVSRTVNQLAVQYCGSIYEEVDEFDVLFVSYQDDPNADVIKSLVSNLVKSKKIDGTLLFDDYFSNTYDRTSEYGSTRAEIFTWTFRLTRLDFNT
jgi:hypothetical protein